MSNNSAQNDSLREDARRSGSGFPLLAAVHLTTVFALLLGCLDTKNLKSVLREPEAAIGIGVIAVGFGACTGICVGLGAVRRIRASLLGAAVGGLAALLTAALICSAHPLRLFVASGVILLVPVLIRAPHA